LGDAFFARKRRTKRDAIKTGPVHFKNILLQKTGKILNGKSIFLLQEENNLKKSNMNYFISTVLKGKAFDETLETVKAELGKEGFGIPSEIDMQDTFKKKIDVDFRKYRILGACNPAFAHKAVLSEKNIGVLLPCSVVVQELENGTIEVAAVDPLTSMAGVKNPTVQEVATEISARLERVIENLAD